MRKTLSTLFAIAAITSCNLDLAPENVMVDQNVYADSKTTQAALIGAYSRMNVYYAGAPEDQNNYSYVSYSFLAGDLGTENLMVYEDGVADCLALQKGEYDNSCRDGEILSTWIKGYNAIDYANCIIDGIDRFADYDEATQKQYQAEARFIRAFVYHSLLRTFGDGALTGNYGGLGLVIRDKPYDGYNPEDPVSRATVKQTWDFIIKDLEIAAADLPASAGTADSRFRATKCAALALLSRVYLYMGSYRNDKDCMDKAAEYATQVLASADYEFSSDWKDYRSSIFPLNEYDADSKVYPDPTVRSKEIIFYQPSRISTTKYTNGLGMYYYTKRLFCVDKAAMADLYLEGDMRGPGDGSSNYLIGIGSTNFHKDEFAPLKYTNSEGYDDVHYIRLAEIKLNLAEALARRDQAVSADALKQLNDIRLKPFEPGKKPAAFKASDFSNVGEFIDEIVKERNRELAFENHRRWDVIRTGGKLRNADLTSAQQILPIPDYEVTISKGKIKQNTAFE